MAFGSFNHHRQKESMSDINVTPMVDVMLVLLVIFILGAPVFTGAVKLDLPQAEAQAAQQPAASVTVAIDAAGALYWNNEAVTMPVLEQRLQEAAKMAPQPELQLRADKDTRYETVAQVMAAAQARGLEKMGFVTDPKDKNNGYRNIEWRSNQGFHHLPPGMPYRIRLPRILRRHHGCMGRLPVLPAR